MKIIITKFTKETYIITCTGLYQLKSVLNCQVCLNEGIKFYLNVFRAEVIWEISIQSSCFLRRGSPVPLLKRPQRKKSNWPFHASRKIRKTVSRSQKKASNQVSRENTNHFHVEQNIYTNTIITKMYLNILVAFDVLNVCIFLFCKQNRNTMTNFEQFCGLLTLFPFLFFSTRSVNRNMLYLRPARSVFESTSMVNGEGSNGHCRSWCQISKPTEAIYSMNRPRKRAIVANIVHKMS